MGEAGKNKSFMIKVAIVVFFMFGFRFIPPFGGMTPYGMATLGIIIGMVIGWSVDPANMSWSSLLGLVALCLTDYPGGITTMLTNLMADSSLMLMCIGMVMVGGVMAANVDGWLISKIMNLPFAKGKPWIITLLLVFAPYILSIFITANLLIVFLFPIYAKLFINAGYKTGDKYVIHVYIGACLSVLCGPYLLPFLGMPLVFSGMFRGYFGDVWTYGSYFLTVSIFTFVMALGYVLFMRLLRCDASKMIDTDFSVFGEVTTLSKHQKYVLGSLLVFVLGSILIVVLGNVPNPLMGIANKISVMGWMILVVVVMILVRVEGKQLLNFAQGTVHGFSWDIILLVASATLVGKALTSAESGFGAALTSLVAPILGGMSPLMIMIVICVFTIIITNACNNMATLMIALTLASALIAGGMPLDGPALAGGILVMSMMGLVLPSSSMYGAFIHTAQLVTPGAVIKNAILSVLYIIFCFCVIYVPLCQIVY